MDARSHRPLRIAHGFGNSRRRLARALQGPVDLIEADVWLQDGKMVVRHERKLGPLPILVDKQAKFDGGPGPGRFGLSLGRWYIKLETSPLPLEELLTRARDRRGLLLDLKGRYGNREEALALALAEMLGRMGMEEQATICGQNWRLLGHLGAAAPHLKIQYSIEGTDRLEAFQTMLECDPIRGICLHQALAERPLIARFKALGMTIYIWTVDDLQRAHELLEMGVDGIISDSLELLGLLGATSR